ncbi:hypothetical protein C0J52_19688 [Blattella germanica]|nr:hypothetical protein C0J52_19688 [Blattella germanica]
MRLRLVKHRDIFLGTWNVRTLYSSGALEILTRELDRTDFVRWPGEGSQESGKFILYYGGATKPEFGTGFLVIIPIYKKGDKTDCNNYRGISLLSTSLTPYIDEIIGNHQCAFRRNRSTID